MNISINEYLNRANNYENNNLTKRIMKAKEDSIIRMHSSVIKTGNNDNKDYLYESDEDNNHKYNLDLLDSPLSKNYKSNKNNNEL